jgi:molybdopterin molybdotransferase
MLDEFDDVREGRRIISANSYTLPALVRDSGGVPFDFGIAAGDEQSLFTKIDAARGCDLIMLSAGVLAGGFDHTQRIMESLGAKLIGADIQIRPGASLTFGTLDGAPWICLSGNPVSAMVTFELFVRPTIRKMRGYDALFPAAYPVRVTEPITISAPYTHFLRAVVSRSSELPLARLTNTQGSAALTSMIEANALLIVPQGRTTVEAGEVLDAIPLSNALLHSYTFPL